MRIHKYDPKYINKYIYMYIVMMGNKILRENIMKKAVFDNEAELFNFKTEEYLFFCS